jgi:hypothetical protein
MFAKNLRIKVMKQYRIINQDSIDAVKKEIRSIPYDGSMVVEIKKYVKKRTNPQNSLAWAGMLNDFSQKVEIDGRKFLPETWHYQLKAMFLPEKFDQEITLPGYVKWVELPCGNMRLIGSTTKLTTKGFSEYMDACYAYGASEFGIKFSTNKGI